MSRNALKALAGIGLILILAEVILLVRVSQPVEVDYEDPTYMMFSAIHVEDGLWLPREDALRAFYEEPDRLNGSGTLHDRPLLDDKELKWYRESGTIAFEFDGGVFILERE